MRIYIVEKNLWGQTNPPKYPIPTTLAPYSKEVKIKKLQKQRKTIKSLTLVATHFHTSLKYLTHLVLLRTLENPTHLFQNIITKKVSWSPQKNPVQNLSKLYKKSVFDTHSPQKFPTVVYKNTFLQLCVIGGHSPQGVSKTFINVSPSVSWTLIHLSFIKVQLPSQFCRKIFFQILNHPHINKFWSMTVKEG